MGWERIAAMFPRTLRFAIVSFHLAAAASQNVSFALHDRHLSVVDESGVRRIVAGPVEVWIGGGQPISGPGQPQTHGASTKFSITSAATLED